MESKDIRNNNTVNVPSLAGEMTVSSFSYIVAAVTELFDI